MSDMSLFDSPADRVLKALPRGVREALLRILSEPEVGADLPSAITEHLRELEDATGSNEFLDLELAKRVAGQSRRLLKEFDSDGTPPAKRSLVRAAARYFILSKDGESDEESIFGLEDDAEVLEAVARELDREDLLCD